MTVDSVAMEAGMSGKQVVETISFPITGDPETDLLTGIWHLLSNTRARYSARQRVMRHLTEKLDEHCQLYNESKPRPENLQELHDEWTRKRELAAKRAAIMREIQADYGGSKPPEKFTPAEEACIIAAASARHNESGRLASGTQGNGDPTEMASPCSGSGPARNIARNVLPDPHAPRTLT